MREKIYFEDKVCTPQTLLTRLKTLARPLVFTNGCFDILHRGHVTYLAQARAKGKSLLVAVNTDDSIRQQNKGRERPLNTLLNRMAVLAALHSVDLVTWFDEQTPLKLISLVEPDILVKGGDWPRDKIVGSKEVLAKGGSVYSIPFIYHTSTTGLVKKIKMKS